MKILLPVILVVLIALGAGFYFFGSQKKQETSPQATPVSTQVATLPLEKRPYVSLFPQTNGHEVKLSVSNINQSKSLEYELVYLVGEASRGVIGSGELNGSTSFARDLLFGSCSKNVCKYDEGVEQGTLTLKLKGEKTQKYEVAFKMQKGSNAKKDLGLTDGNFSFQGKLSSGQLYLVYGAIGVPKMPEGKVVGGPYSLTSSGGSAIKGAIQMRLVEPTKEVKVYGWDKSSSSWKEYLKSFETDGKTVSVETDSLTTYIAVAS